jgi:calcineurin-like phosphoesterase family protein
MEKGLMAVFATSDGHIGHRTIAVMRWHSTHPEVGQASDPIPERAVQWHDYMLAEKWDSVVKPDDIVYYLGDLSMDGKANAENALEWIKARPGIKRLVPGNHDPIMPGVNRDAGKWMARYLEAFEWVFPYYRYKVAGTNVLMSHFPYQGGGDHTAVERFGQYRLPFLGEWLLHGHTHSDQKAWASEEYSGSHRQIHVGVDAWDYTPVPIEEIARIINASVVAEVREQRGAVDENQ